MTVTTKNAVNTPAIKINRAFEVGTIYRAFTCGKGFTSYKVTARTAKFVTVENLTDGTQKRCKIDLESEKYYVGGYYSTEEVIRPDKKASAITPSDIDHKAMKANEANAETATVAEENSEVISRDENGEVEKIKSGNYIYKIRNTEYSAGVKHFWELQHEVAGLDEGAAIAIARSLHGAEFQAELINYLEGKLVNEYAISEDAFNFAVEYEIEEAAIVAGEARAIARILANETLKIRYDKAKTQVKYERYENGYCGWYFKGKNRDNWECNVTKATACLTRYGLSRFEFIIFSENEPAVIDNNGYDETAFELLPTVDELNDIDDTTKTYTLTIYTDVWIDGDNTLVKNYDTCRRLHISGKYLISKHSWKLTRGGKTIATGDGVKDFCHFITCEFDVSERFAEIADAKGATLEICGENIWFRNGKCIFVYSPKYHASFYVEAGIDGNEHYEINKSDERGNFSRFEFVTEEEFFNTIERRGGCTVADGEVEYTGDAQAILVVTFINDIKESKRFETANAAIAFARECEKNSLIKRGYVMGDNKHYGNEIIYEFNKRTQAILNDDDGEIGTNVDIRGFTDEDFLSELTVTLDINAAVEKILATADNFRYLAQRHEITLTKPDSEVIWESDFRGYKDGKSFLVTEIYNHPNGTLREVLVRKNELSALPVITVQIEQAIDTSEKIVATEIKPTAGNSEFADKVATLTAELDSAQSVYNETCKACEIKHEEYRQACEVDEMTA